MSDLSVRLATLADAPVVAGFNIALAAESEGLRLDPQVVEQGVHAILTDASRGLYFVAVERSGEILGQIMITYEWSDWRNGNIWWLQSVYVKPAYRGKGVFRSLFKTIQEKAASEPGVRGLRLYMHRDNASARAVYEKLGFENTAYEVFELPVSGRTGD